jgi:hypothetical protein
MGVSIGATRPSDRREEILTAGDTAPERVSVDAGRDELRPSDVSPSGMSPIAAALTRFAGTDTRCAFFA